MNINELTCGLDFGTSNSIISLTDKATRKEVFSYSESSILYFPDTNEMKYYVDAAWSRHWKKATKPHWTMR